MALEVIGAGLGRTGTTTLKAALETLGFGPCHHMSEVFADPERQVPFWNRVAGGEPFDWEELYRDYRATVDWPGAHYYAALADRYPEAKVILSLRAPWRWAESLRETILQAMARRGLLDGGAPDHPLRFYGIIIARETFNCDYGEENLIATFQRHNADVQRRIAPERLLEFEPSDGWAPLCAFLGVPVPDEPFPRTNSREDFWADVDRLLAEHPEQMPSTAP